MRSTAPFAILALLIMPPTARAGLHYSGESIAELPSQWRGYLLDHRGLRALALPQAPGMPPSPLRTEYHDALARLDDQQLTGLKQADLLLILDWLMAVAALK